MMSSLGWLVEYFQACGSYFTGSSEISSTRGSLPFSEILSFSTSFLTSSMSSKIGGVGLGID